MNQTTTGCGNCYYYFNGQCTKTDICNSTGYTTVISNHTIGVNEAYNPNTGVNECGPSLPDDIINNLPDDYMIPDFTTPEEMHYPREEYRTQVGELYCLICGKPLPWYWGESYRPIVCDECKQAIAWAKEKMKEKE